MPGWDALGRTGAVGAERVVKARARHVVRAGQGRDGRGWRGETCRREAGRAALGWVVIDRVRYLLSEVHMRASCCSSKWSETLSSPTFFATARRNALFIEASCSANSY